MALISCRNCGHMVSDRAVQCPHCGAPINNTSVPPQRQQESEQAHYKHHELIGAKRSRTNIWLYVIIALLTVFLLAVVILFVANSSDENKEDSTNQSKAIENPELIKETVGYGAIYDETLSPSSTAHSTSRSSAPAEEGSVSFYDMPDGAYVYEGLWNVGAAQGEEEQRCQILFTKSGNKLYHCSYINLRWSATIPLQGSIRGETLHFAGKIQGKDFVIDLYAPYDTDHLEGTGIDYKHSGFARRMRLERR